MHVRTLKADLLLLLTSIIWGFAFVAQRVGMEHVGPFIFNGIRFALGSLSLLPLLWINHTRGNFTHHPPRKTLLFGGTLAGIALFLGVSFQQIGLIYTTAGKAGFITGLYIVFVPIVGVAFLKQKTALGTWIGTIFAVIGLYLLSVTKQFTIDRGDLFVLIGAMFWACHIHIISWFSRKVAPLKLAFLQFVICSFLSLLIAGIFERTTLQGLTHATIPILYGGLCSVGIAYTLQVIAQRTAHPAHASIILSLEAMFAVIGGWIVLGETLAFRGLMGCALMLAGMLLSQFTITASHLSRWIKRFSH
jgi:drug/metabolite transporter (DMT)-like permease